MTAIVLLKLQHPDGSSILRILLFGGNILESNHIVAVSSRISTPSPWTRKIWRLNLREVGGFLLSWKKVLDIHDSAENSCCHRWRNRYEWGEVKTAKNMLYFSSICICNYYDDYYLIYDSFWFFAIWLRYTQMRTAFPLELPSVYS